MLSISLFD